MRSEFTYRIGGSSALSVLVTFPLTAASTGKRIALGSSTKGVRLSAASAGSIYFKFTDASGAISVSSSDTVQAVGTTPVDVSVPSGLGYFEYLRVGGSDVQFNLGLLV